ncbi:glycosyltransferase [Neolewinella aurantiaca]|uniref:Glycosyltransferase n=1 Tax=Neolewinella aurantiaca TaxID=2602767 RepID=A0A5C7FND1_9BACT|nr:glycosyltransferase family 2 protein [Neolewinella aurantiaca]TXF91725.1 glycosyltransferase [Neolewinella aurantiaca]
MDLSIVIVNYNVRYFLEQALLSVERAIVGLETEVWVVDNNSADASVEMVRERFPWVRVIANKHNPGFSIANNQAIRKATGKYVLLLNPDTVVEEDTFRRCYDFMEEHPDGGGLGVRMIDGRGRFLPESKRGLPTPWVAFTKAFGLARLFPKSKRFGHYHLRYLAENEIHEIEILSGAFMWMRRKALDEVGLLDEDYFMYGEDIDLSYRLLKGGYKNYYLPTTNIIHYKGESTKRGSLNYVRVFYQAMIIFARKHFAGADAGAMIGLMRLGIYLRAVLTVVANIWRALKFPLLDGVGIYLGLLLLKSLWSEYHFDDLNYFPEHINYLHFPAYTLLWTGSIFLGGGYDKPFDFGRLLRSLGIGTLLLFAVYGLLPEDLRPSRALLLLGAAWAATWTCLVRVGAHLLQHGHLRVASESDQRLLIIGSQEETERTLSLLQRAGVRRNYLGRIAPGTVAGGQVAETNHVGRTDQLEELASIYRADEIIFCSADLSMESIQRWMSRLGPTLEYRILPEASSSIIGSHRSDQRGTLYTINANLRIDEASNRRAKWLFDKGTSLLMIVLFPVLIWLVKNKGAFAGNCFRVLTGGRSWVGYALPDPKLDALPVLRPAVFSPATGTGVTDPATLHQVNFLYARDYSVGEDWRLLLHGIFKGD